MSTSGDPAGATIDGGQRRRLYILGLVLGHSIAAVVAILPFTAGFSDYAWPRWQAILIEALACGQLSVATIMVAAEWPALPIRIGVLAGVLAVWLLALNLTLEDECWPKIFAIQTLVIAGLLFVARIVGARLVFGQENGQGVDSRTSIGFSLRQMLLAMTVVSLVLGLGMVAQRVLGPRRAIEIANGMYPRATVMGWCFAGIALTAVIAALAESRRVMLFFGFALIVILAGLANWHADKVFRHSWWSSLSLDIYHTAYQWLTSWYAVVVYGSLLVLRGCGMRLQMSWRAERGGGETSTGLGSC